MQEGLEPGEGLAVGEDDLGDRGPVGPAAVVEGAFAEPLANGVTNGVVLGQKPVHDVVAREHLGAVARERGEGLALAGSDSPPLLRPPAAGGMS